MKKVTFIMLVIALLLSSCATVVGVAPQPPQGDVWVTATNTTVYWVNQALQGAPFTQILTNGQGGYFIIWNPTGSNGVGFTLINEAGTSAKTVLDWVKITGGKGNLVNFRDMSGVVKYMEDAGWKPIAFGGVPTGLRLYWYQLWQTVTLGALSLGETLISIIVVPIMIIPDELLDPYHESTIMT